MVYFFDVNLVSFNINGLHLNLNYRRRNDGFFIVFVRINNRINAPELLLLLKFFEQPRTLKSGSDFLFRILFYHNCGAFEPMTICVLFNQFNYLFDFNIARESFRLSIRLITTPS